MDNCIAKSVSELTKSGLSKVDAQRLHDHLVNLPRYAVGDIVSCPDAVYVAVERRLPASSGRWRDGVVISPSPSPSSPRSRPRHPDPDPDPRYPDSDPDPDLRPQIQVWSKYRGLHGNKFDATTGVGIKRNQWAAAKVMKVDGDFRSYTILYIQFDHTVGGQTPFRLRMRDEKVLPLVLLLVNFTMHVRSCADQNKDQGGVCCTQVISTLALAPSPRALVLDPRPRPSPSTNLPSPPPTPHPPPPNATPGRHDPSVRPSPSPSPSSSPYPLPLPHTHDRRTA